MSQKRSHELRLAGRAARSDHVRCRKLDDSWWSCEMQQMLATVEFARRRPSSFGGMAPSLLYWAAHCHLWVPAALKHNTSRHRAASGFSVDTIVNWAKNDCRFNVRIKPKILISHFERYDRTNLPQPCARNIGSRLYQFREPR